LTFVKCGEEPVVGVADSNPYNAAALAMAPALDAVELRHPERDAMVVTTSEYVPKAMNE